MVFRILLLILFCSVSVLGQSKVDSLTALLPTIKGNEKADLLIQLSRSTGRIDPDKAREYAAEALELAQSIGYTEAETTSLMCLATLDSRNGDFEEAEKNSLQALKIASEGSLTEECSKAGIVLGNLYFRQEELSRALEVYITGLANAEKVNNTQHISTYLINIGTIEQELGHFDEAEKYFHRALEHIRQQDSRSDPNGVSTDLAAGVKINLGIIENEKGNFERAMEWFEKALDRFSSTDNQYYVGQVLSNMGRAQESMGQFDEAKESFVSAGKIAESMGNQLSQTQATLNIARILFKQNRSEESLAHAQKALTSSEELKLWSLTSQANEILADLSENEGDFKEALAYRKAYEVARDTAITRENAKELSKVLKQFEFEKLQLKTERQEQEMMVKSLKLRQRNILLVGVSFILILLTALFWAYRRKAVSDLEQADHGRRTAEVRAQQLEEELKVERENLMNYTKKLLADAPVEDMQDNGNDDPEKSASELRTSIMNDKDWGAFNALFDSAYPGFIEKLEGAFPDLTLYEQRLLMLIKLRLSNKETATILGISRESVAQAKYRLRKKLALDSTGDIETLLSNFA